MCQEDSAGLRTVLAHEKMMEQKGIVNGENKCRKNKKSPHGNG